MDPEDRNPTDPPEPERPPPVHQLRRRDAPGPPGVPWASASNVDDAPPWRQQPVRNNALYATYGPTEPPPPPPPSPESQSIPEGQRAELEARSAGASQGGAALSREGGMSADTTIILRPPGRAQIIDRLSDRPAEIREAALMLAAAIQDEIDRLNRSTPNDDALPQHKAFVSFLEAIADGLRKIADALERSIKAAEAKSPDQQKGTDRTPRAFSS